MKRIKTFLLLIFCTLISGFYSYGDEGEDKPISIIIGKDKKPRIPSETPITAYYQSGVIYIQFSEDLGCLDVEVINSTTNQQWIDVACSYNSTEAIVISTTPGNYTITLTTEDGIEYSGQFTL